MTEQLSMFEENMNKEDEGRSYTEEMRRLVDVLNEASRVYYQEAGEVMTNMEYDRLYDSLEELEKKTGTVFSDSPTRRVGYEVLSELPKEAHPSKMLSLDKTKDVEVLKSFVGDRTALMSWKLDGLTVVLTYEDGVLSKAVTRGNGEIGEVITNNARVFKNIPVNIAFKGKLVIRGEAVITYAEFRRINETITDEGAKYKNPRNLCSGSVRQLDPTITRKRGVEFFAFSLVTAEGKSFEKRSRQFDWLESLGFRVVEHREVTGDSVEAAVRYFSEHIEENPVPSDGLVVSFDDIEYGRSLGVTAKFPRDSIAFKWQDETAETILKEIEWSASRTGLINPVAVFEPVELEGTTVSRASVHNISVMRELKLGRGDRIKVYKANMIIPQISENLSRTDSIEIPCACPVCAEPTVIKNENGVQTLFCRNQECPAKQIKGFSHFVSRDALNIEGLSESTLEKLVDRGIIRSYADIFRLGEHEAEIKEMEGFGETSFVNLRSSVERSRTVTPQAFLYALGIPNFGRANCGLIAGYCRNDWDAISGLKEDELLKIDGIGSVMAEAFVKFFADPVNKERIEELLHEVKLMTEYEEAGSRLSGMTFVITGSLNSYSNRDELKALIESEGGRVAGSVSQKTSYLINNDVNSHSGKNKKARELGIPVISEEEFKKLL